MEWSKTAILRNVLGDMALWADRAKCEIAMPKTEQLALYPSPPSSAPRADTSVVPPFSLRSPSVFETEVGRRCHGGGTEVLRRYQRAVREGA